MVELVWLHSAGLSPSLADLPSTLRAQALLQALQEETLVQVSRGKEGAGFSRTLWGHESDDPRLYRFCSAAQEAAERAGISRDVARQVVGAIGELEDNIHLHSENARSGVIAFSATPGTFEFVIADQGIGVLRSLHMWPEHRSISDHGSALEAAIRRGATRFGPNSGHGNGFRQLFVGLYNLNSMLRFRSGDHALVLDGRVGKEKAQLFRAAANIPGFITSVVCRP
jgi:hypothetical protein